MAAVLSSFSRVIVPEWPGVLETPERITLYWQLLQSRAARLRPAVQIAPSRYATVPLYYVLPPTSSARAVIMTPQRDHDDWLAAAFLLEWHAAYWADGANVRRDPTPVIMPFPGNAWRSQDASFWEPLFKAPLAW